MATDDSLRDIDYARWSAPVRAGPGMGARRPAVRQRRHLHRTGQGPGRGSPAQRQGAGGRQSRQHQRLHRDEVGAPAAEEEFHRHAAPDHNRALSQLAAKSGKPVAAIRKLVVGQSTRPPCTRTCFATVDGQSPRGLTQRRRRNKDTFIPRGAKRAPPSSRRAAASALAQRRHRPHARLGAGHQRRVGHHGHPVRRQAHGAFPEETMYGFPII